MSDYRCKAPALALCSVLLLVVLSSGCGPNRPLMGKVVNGSSQVKGAVREAQRYAQDANPGSSFKVVKKCAFGGWACVTVEETGVPADEAVTFAVFMRELDGGEWEVVTSGSDLSPEDLPDAPAELFQQ